MVVTLPTIEIRRLQERVQLGRQITDWSRCQHMLLSSDMATFGLRGVNIYNEGSIAMEAAVQKVTQGSEINEQKDISMGKRENACCFHGQRQQSLEEK